MLTPPAAARSCSFCLVSSSIMSFRLSSSSINLRSAGVAAVVA
jgi:hypothetical protein